MPGKGERCLIFGGPAVMRGRGLGGLFVPKPTRDVMYQQSYSV